MAANILSVICVFAIGAALAWGIGEICPTTPKLLCAGFGAIAGATLGVVAIAIVIVGNGQ